MKAKMKLYKLLSILLCCVVLTGILPMSAYAWETTTYCDFCGEFIADNWICGGGDHCGPDSGHSDCFEENHCQDCGDCRDDGDWCETCHMHIQCAIDNDCHCPNCEACISGGGVVTCDSCGEYCSECGDDWCDKCNLCVFCGVADNSHCEDCYACTAAEGCQLCYRCFDCGGVCSDGCDDLCLECHWAEGGACEECDTCYIHDDTVYCPTCKLCHNCTGGYCESCGQCGSDVILCGGCGMYCSECVPICEVCGDVCTECSEELCPSCYTCNNCVVMCVNCYNCVNCFDFCSFCGLCEECTTLCENCYEVCGDCVSMCNICLICEEYTDLCDNCHELCGACAILCSGCLWCEECADICPACGEVCSNCGTICEDCGLCEDCCEASTTTTISTVDVTITEPVAGAQPQNAISNTENVSVYTTVWGKSNGGGFLSETDTFVEGDPYRAIVMLEAGNGYVFAENPTVIVNGSAASMVSIINGYIYFAVDFVGSVVPTGYTVSGTVTSFGSDTDNVILQLIAEGFSESDYEVFVKGNTAEYSIEGVASGTYTMKVMKQNHVTREYTVTVSTENVTQDVKIHLKGDINGDGRVNTSDVGKINSHAKGTNKLW